ncbi:MAG: hypothetical protein K2M76_00810, partial [Muribaculaceae bacterium]|nr:hypothetical protein [Muribaculaceae bacterium]
YLENLRQLTANYFSTMPFVELTDGATGEKFMMYNMASGYCSAYPKDGDDITQTSSANFIVTERGIRFREPFKIERADINADPMVIENFLIQEDGSLKAEDGSEIRADSFENAFINSGRPWRMDRTASSPIYDTFFTDMNKEIGASARGQRLQYVQMSYNKTNGFVVNIRTNSLSANIYMNIEVSENNTFKVTYNNADKNGLVMYSLPAVKSFIDHLSSAPLTAKFDSAMAMTTMSLSLASNPAEVLSLNIQ